MQVEIDFEVYKGLTALRRHEDHSYNDVIRELLKLPVPSLKAQGHDGSSLHATEQPAKRSFESRDLSLPHGTQLKATYKGRVYTARIDDGRWVDSEGREHGSPSAAARFITGSNVNGLRFWQARRMGDHDWWKLDVLVLLG
ncbi:MAG TPA: DUF2924 domain-containing protein [Allosphingosinicella sp.]|nr:DUF2924 domain-containing protein [Allosphingosinicella sp.]